MKPLASPWLVWRTPPPAGTRGHRALHEIRSDHLAYDPSPQDVLASMKELAAVDGSLEAASK
jgi:hypothetical protein